MNELILPWPSRQLRPNARVHWAQKARATKHDRHTADVLALSAGWARQPLPDGQLFLWIDFFPPDKRKRDTDNLVANIKAYIDGIADAVGVNDSRFALRPYLMDEVRKGGEVRVRITGGPK